MSGRVIYQWFLDFFNLIVDFSTTTFDIFSSTLSSVSARYIPWEWLRSLIDIITDSIGDPTLLELTIGSVGLLVAISLVKWVIDIIF